MTIPSHRPQSLATAEDVNETLALVKALHELVYDQMKDIEARIEALEARK